MHMVLPLDPSLGQAEKVSRGPSWFSSGVFVCAGDLWRQRMCPLFTLTQVVETIRPYAEVLYFLSGVGLLIVAVYGLKQLHLLKEDIRTRNTRAAREKALEAATTYAREFVPNYNKYYATLQQANLVSYKGSIGDFSPNSLTLAEKQGALARMKLLPGPGLDALNSLDLIASTFVHGLGDDNVGFRILGRSFCRTVADNYDIFALWRNAHYDDTERLYQIWRKRITKEDLEATRTKLDQDIAKIEEETLEQIRPDI
jgi:hypothetical protein